MAEVKEVISQTEQDSDEEVIMSKVAGGVSQEEGDESEEGASEEGESEEGASEEEGESEEGCVPIDLSQNEVYRGVCTLFEDEEGNNILEYISLLHTELIGINKSLENLRNIRKDISRLADCAEFYVKSSMAAEQSKSSSKEQDSSKKSKKH